MIRQSAIFFDFNFVDMDAFTEAGTWRKNWKAGSLHFTTEGWTAYGIAFCSSVFLIQGFCYKHIISPAHFIYSKCYDYTFFLLFVNAGRCTGGQVGNC